MMRRAMRRKTPDLEKVENPRRTATSWQIDPNSRSKLSDY
jgi:hypothetical protein